MSNEKRDEFLSWRTRLEQSEGVAGQGLDDREATWDRLMERFREKPRRRRPVYGIVAACLLLALIPAVRMFQDRSPRDTVVRHLRSPEATPLAFRPEARRAVHSPPASGIAPSQGTDREGSRDYLGPGAKGSANPQHAPAGKPDIRRTGRHTGNLPARELLPSVAAVTDSSIHAPVAPAVSYLAPPVLAQQTPVMRMKWKVVDLNELNSGWQTPHSMASNFIPGSLRIGPGSLTPGPAGASTLEKPSIKIQLSP